jgi:hypothetical protein
MIDLTNLLIDIEDQRHYNSCGGQAATTYLEAIWKKFSPDAQEFSPAYLWQMTKIRMGNKPDANVGVSIGSLFGTLKEVGCVHEVDYPYNDVNLNRTPPEFFKQGAKLNRIAGFRFVTIAEINCILDKGLPVFVFLRMGGGHFVSVFGHKPGYKLIVNSWGNEWMEQGKQWISDDEFKKLYLSGCIITGLKWGWLKAAQTWIKGILK